MDEWIECLRSARESARASEMKLVEALQHTEPDGIQRSVTRLIGALAQELRISLEAALDEKGEKQG